MKKVLLYSIIIVIIIVLIKYRFSNYSINYTIDNYNVKTTYKDGRFYYEIKKDDLVYNFDVYKGRNFNKTIISKIVKIEDENINCIYPSINDTKTYPLCYENGIYKDYNLIESSLLDDYKKEKKDIDKSSKDFVYFNTLSEDEYVALWNYKGYIVMNGKNYDNIELFDKDKYDNSLAYLINDTIYMPDNNQEHEFTNIVGLNLTDFSSEIFDIGYTIDYDSYVVGAIDNKLYLFDNKHTILYEIDVKDNSAKIIGNNEKGFVKYENGEFVSCSKSEYKINKIKYDTSKSLYKYEYNDGVNKTINENKNLSQRIINSKVKTVSEHKNKLYYSIDDTLYMYEPIMGSSEIFYSFEMKFNSDNTIFVYNK